MVKKIYLTSLLIIMILTLIGCGGSNTQVTEQKKEQGQSAVSKAAEMSKPEELSDKSMNQVELLITRNYGNEIILRHEAKIQEGWTVMDLLVSEAEIKTKYGGGFIDSINGLKSASGGFHGDMWDWFYFVNGISPDIGALDYTLQTGEKIWWDYHVWQAGQASSAVIGCYPEPFLHGYLGKTSMTTIMCPPDDLETGYRLQQALVAQGAANIKVMPIDDQLLGDRLGPVIVLGEWEKLSNSLFLEKFNRDFKRNGTGVHFNGMTLEIIDIQGQAEKSLDESAGVIVAAGSGLGDTSPLWMVSGTDFPGFQSALDLIIDDPDAIAGCYGVVISKGEIMPIPIF